MTAGLGDKVPDDFPRTTYNEVVRRVHTFVYQESMGTFALDHFLDSWLAGGYRFCTCSEHDVAFRASLQRGGSNPPQGEHYVQERELFGFFVSGLTAIESFAYSSYALGAILDDENFPMAHPRTIRVDSAAHKLKKFFPGERLGEVLDQIKNDDEYMSWRKIRNILAHRVVPARLVSVTLWPPDPDPTPRVSWTEDGIALDANITASRREWLAQAVTKLVAAARSFTLSHFRKQATH